MNVTTPVIYTFDIGRAFTRAGVYTGGPLVLAGVEPTPQAAKSPERNAAAISSLLHMFYLDMIARFPLPDAVAVAVSNQLLDANGLHNGAIMSLLHDLGWRVPFHVENDANAALRSVVRRPTALGFDLGTGVSVAVKRDHEIQSFDNAWSHLDEVISSHALAERYDVEPENAGPEVYAQMREDVVAYLAPAIGEALDASGCEVVILSGRSILGFAENFELVDAIQAELAETHPGLEGVVVELGRMSDTSGMMGAALALIDDELLIEEAAAGF